MNDRAVDAPRASRATGTVGGLGPPSHRHRFAVPKSWIACGAGCRKLQTSAQRCTVRHATEHGLGTAQDPPRSFQATHTAPVGTARRTVVASRHVREPVRRRPSHLADTHETSHASLMSCLVSRPCRHRRGRGLTSCSSSTMVRAATCDATSLTRALGWALSRVGPCQGFSLRNVSRWGRSR